MSYSSKIPRPLPLPPVSVTVGTTSAAILNANPTRTGLVIINLSNTTVSFGLGMSAVLYSGISLTSGGVWEVDPFLYSTDIIYAVASDVTTLSIQEFTY